MPSSDQTGAMARHAHTPTTANHMQQSLRTQRRLAFINDVARMMAETGRTQHDCFEIYNGKYPTFASYRAFKIFKHRNHLKPINAVSLEISGIFSDLVAIDSEHVAGEIAGGHIATREDLYNDDRAERERIVAALREGIQADPAFLERLLYDYARMIQ